MIGHMQKMYFSAAYMDSQEWKPGKGLSQPLGQSRPPQETKKTAQELVQVSNIPTSETRGYPGKRLNRRRTKAAKVDLPKTTSGTPNQILTFAEKQILRYQISSQPPSPVSTTPNHNILHLTKPHFASGTT